MPQFQRRSGQITQICALFRLVVDDLDGRLDVFVANDTVPNFLFRNEGSGRFREVGLNSGIAFNDDGRAVSSMGADARDIDNDGREER